MKDTAESGRIAAWCPAASDINTRSKLYLQVDLGRERTITYIATQGITNNHYVIVHNFTNKDQLNQH